MNRVIIAALLSFMVLVVIDRGESQNGPSLQHSAVAFWQPIGFVVVTAETRTKQYLKIDLYVALDYPFPPTSVGPLGTLFINPGALAYWRQGFRLKVDFYKKWVTLNSIWYPPIPRSMVGTKLRVQVVAYDATVPNRVVLSANAATFTIVYG